jgi:hypothetical protein
MAVLALAIGPRELATRRMAGGGPWTVRRIPVPDAEIWCGCRDLLLDTAGDDEITAVGIACPDSLGRPIGVVEAPGSSAWRGGVDIGAAVRRMFPVATVWTATHRLCLSLTDRNSGVCVAEAVLTGAAILALIAEERSCAGLPFGLDDNNRKDYFSPRPDVAHKRRSICVRPQLR